MTPLVTVLVGVGVFVVSQYILKLILEPITRVRRAVADVSSTVLFRQAKISNAIYHPETADELRRASSQLRASISEVRCYSLLSHLGLFGIPTKANARGACRCLNLMAGNSSNDTQDRMRLVEENNKALVEVGKLLSTETTY